jgi:Tfp pilus assembly protein PilV
MNCRIPSRSHGASAARRSPASLRQAGFTLAEVLAAMLFLAIVIPVAVGGLRIASLAGEVAARKAVAARIAERTLNEAVVTGQIQKGALAGTVTEGNSDYRWSITVGPSSLDTLRLATVTVAFPAQGTDYDVSLSTLVDTQ